MKDMCENYDLTMPSSVESLCRNELPNGRKGEKKMGIERRKEMGREGRGAKGEGEKEGEEEARGEGRVEGGRRGGREGRKRGGARELGEKGGNRWKNEE